MDKSVFQKHELEAYLGGFEGDFDVEAIIGDATEVDFRTGRRYWREGIDLAAICESHDLPERR